MADEQQKTSGGCCGGAAEGRTCGCGHGGMKRCGLAGLGLIMIAGALYLLALFAGELKEYKYIGLPDAQQATISVSGDGEAYGAPDIAVVSFSVVAEAKTVAAAQKDATEKMAAILAFLKKSGIAEKDIKTTSYNFYPKYEWQTKGMSVCYDTYCPPQGKQVLIGYEVTQSVDIKIRKIDDAGMIVGGLGENGATNMSDLTLKVEEEDGLKAEARAEAIAKAKAKADVLAQSLGVKLVRIVAYNEGGDYPPIYNFARTMAADGMGGAEKAAPDIPTGENKFVSNVTIVYEIQ